MPAPLPSRPGLARLVPAVVFALGLLPTPARGQYTWNQPAGGSWATAANWATTGPAAPPNAIDATVTFYDAANGSIPAQTGNRSVTLDGTFTVGSITFNNDAANAFTNTIATGTTGSRLTFDVTGTGPAMIFVPAGGGTGNNTISAPMTLNVNLVAQVDNQNVASAAGALNLTGAMNGVGGFTKLGNGLTTFGTGAKTYTGPTVIGGGRMRVSLIAAPTATSSFTINAGGQLDLIAAGTFTFGSGPLNLNGAGPTSGQFSVFPGAIRNDTGLLVTLTNNVVLQSDTVIHVQATAGTGVNSTPTGSTTFSGNVSGPGKLTFTAPGSNIDQGLLVLTGTNSYTGGTQVNGGILVAQAASVNAFGTGNVNVDPAATSGSIARLRIEAGATNAISDTATLRLAGGGIISGAGGVQAVQGSADLQTGVSETVGTLILGSTVMPPGSYGSSTSPAQFPMDQFFTGDGVVVVQTPVPEPAGVLLVCGVAAGGLAWRRRRRIVGR